VVQLQGSVVPEADAPFAGHLLHPGPHGDHQLCKVPIEHKGIKELRMPCYSLLAEASLAVAEVPDLEAAEEQLYGRTG